MELIKYGLDVVLHLDHHLGLIVKEYGFWTHLFLFAVIFCETGLVVAPFLPGDSLLFAAGTFAALGSLDLSGLLCFLSIAAVAGDTVNYWAGSMVGPRVFSRKASRLLNMEHLHRTHRFFEKHGGKTIILARFVPIIRTFAPFVAGVGSMTYGRFIVYNMAGGVGWVLILTLGGYLFGNIPVVRSNFTFVILAIIALSVLPGIIGLVRERSRRRVEQLSG